MFRRAARTSPGGRAEEKGGGGIWHLRDGVWAPELPHARQEASPPSHLSDFIEVFRVPADLATQQKVQAATASLWLDYRVG